MNKADLGALLEAFFRKRLISQRRASPHTVASYRDTFRLLLAFAQKQTNRPPAQSSPHSDSFILSLCRSGSTPARRQHPAGAGHTEQALQASVSRVPDSAGD